MQGPKAQRLQAMSTFKDCSEVKQGRLTPAASAAEDDKEHVRVQQHGLALTSN